jgi:signal transduction histidine kinase
MRVTPKQIDMGEACARIVGELRANYPARVIEMEKVGDLECICDEQRMAQAISNLLNNALRHGAPETSVRARVDGSAPDQIAVSVQNGGTPIPRAIRESLFEPLVRGPESNGTGYNLGLGLYIVREIALAHGGSASVESDIATGTVFVIRIPRDASAAVSAFPGIHLN